MKTTFPQLLLKHAAERPTDPAVREKEYGIWQTWTWKDAAQTVQQLACGLLALGFRRGQNLALIGDNRPHLYMSMVAVQSVGGVPIPLYQDAVATEMTFVIEDAEVQFFFAENQEQVDKLLEVRESVPSVTHIIYDDPRGLRNYEQPGLISTEKLMALGAEWDRAHPGAWKAEVERNRPEDVSVILYTSGTTGKPKGVCQTHSAFIASAQGGVEVDRLVPTDNIISYLPPAWVGDHLFSVAQWLVAGFTINCPESAGTVSIDLREIGPTYYFAPPRVFEGMLTSVSIRMEDAAPFKRWLYAKAMELARRVGADILDGKPVGGGDRLLYKLYDMAVYGPLRNVLGLSRIRVAYTAGAAIGPDLFRFYRSIGINLKQLYGQTETCAYVCLQPDRQVDLDSVGQAAPGVELKIADNGEVLVKGASVLKEYYKRPDATAEVDRRRRLLPHRRRGLLRRRRPPARSSTAPRTWASSAAAPCSRPTTSRTSSSSSRTSRRRVLRPRPRPGLRLHQHRHRGRWATGPSARAWPTPAIPTWPPTLPGPAQGTRSRRRRADPHAQGAARLRRREVRRADRRAVWRQDRRSSSRPRSSSRTAAPARSADLDRAMPRRPGRKACLRKAA
jgi:long-chain acyl-CoA synthetase